MAQLGDAHPNRCGSESPTAYQAQSLKPHRGQPEAIRRPDHMKLFTSLAIAATLVGAPVMADPIIKDLNASTRELLDALQGFVTIREGESLMSVVREHGITLTQLKALNPGVKLSKLEVGDRVRVAPKSLAVRPLRSGGASWPDLQSLPGSSRTMPVSTTYTAPDSAQKQAIREQIERQREKERIAAARRADAEHAARLRREEARRQRYRSIGGCTYDWQSWGKSPSGVRSVKASGCSGVTEVAVDCSNTKISKLKWRKWRSWEVPSAGFENLVVESCANVLGASKPTYIQPIIPASAPAPKPRTTTVTKPKSTCTGPTVLCEFP